MEQFSDVFGFIKNFYRQVVDRDFEDDQKATDEFLSHVTEELVKLVFKKRGVGRSTLMIQHTI